MRARSTERTSRLLAVALAGAMALAACAEDSDGASGGSGSGQGVPFGATKEQYLAAFENISPIVIRTQTPAPKGSPTGARNEDYIKAVEEWSGGKIKFEVAYANAVAQPAEADDALRDGRLHLTNTMPVYEPSEYPAAVALNDASFQGRQTPLVGVMATHAWMVEVAFNTPKIMEEFDKAGMHVLIPAFMSGHSLMVCSDRRTSLADFRGMQILSGGQTQSKEIEALGAVPMSVPYNEVFESLQRKVAKCTVSTLLGVDLGGYAEVANKVTSSPDVGYSITTGTFAIEKEFWESLPLVAKQLLFDRLDVFLESSIKGTWQASARAVDAILKAGGSFQEYAPDAAQALRAANEQLLQQARANSALGDGGAFVDRVKASSDKWSQKVVDLGYQDVDDFVKFAELINQNPPDLRPFIDAVFQEILLPHRPS